jgi:hypothetical protein
MQATPVGSARLSFDLFIGNRAEAFFLPPTPTLDWATVVLNQQARVDILLRRQRSVQHGRGDLLLNLFATGPWRPAGVRLQPLLEVDITDLLNANLNQTPAPALQRGRQRQPVPVRRGQRGARDRRCERSAGTGIDAAAAGRTGLAQRTISKRIIIAWSSCM